MWPEVVMRAARVVTPDHEHRLLPMPGRRTSQVDPQPTGNAHDVTTRETPALDVAVLHGQLNDALRREQATVESLVVHPVTGLVLVSIKLPDLQESEQRRKQEQAEIDLQIVEASYSGDGYVFVPVFAPE
jgi:hypothetical protein